jgi:hypothetical protein
MENKELKFLFILFLISLLLRVIYVLCINIAPWCDMAE